MTDLISLSISDALAGLKTKKFSARNLADAHIAQMEKMRHLNAYVTEAAELARTQADAADKNYASGTARGLEGIPLAIKDMFCTKGLRTTASSKILDTFIPPYESTVSQKLLDAGAVFLGKTNQDEFAMGGSTTTSAYGPTISPWRRNADPKTNLVAGGSSGGSAAAVAAHMAMGATGTDTGGSIRQPASYCGIAGIKPTYGRCSRFGIIAFASSLDQAGVFARNVADCATLLHTISGYDANDSTSANVPVPDFVGGLNGDIRGMKVGIPKEYRVEGMPKEIEAIWQKGIDWLKDAGAEIVDITLPHTKYAVPTYYIIAPAEASSNLARYDGMRYGVRVNGDNLVETYEKSRGAGFGAEVKRRIMVGTYALSSGYYDAYYIKAQRVRRLIANDFAAAYKLCDIILAPTAPSGAFAIGENEDDPVKMYLNDVFTIPASLAGLPGMSVPAGLDATGLPLGLQIIGRPWDEVNVLKVGQAIEKAAAFSARAADLSRAA
jgi:aspartyl-tRNA(Asn)/glutamyl-tRNA(Gln) amidotransferase subunit A